MLLVTAACLPLTGIGLNVSSGTGLELTYISGVLATLLVFLHADVRRARLTEIDLAVVVFYFVVLASVIMSAWVPVPEFRNERPWIQSAKQVIKLTAALTVYVTARATFPRLRRRRLVITTMIAGLAAAALYGCYQWFSLVFEVPLPFTRIPGFLANASYGYDFRVGARGDIPLAYGLLPRVSSFAIEPAFFGNVLVLGLALTLHDAFVRSAGSQLPRRALFLPVLLLWGIIISGSRAPLIAACALIVLFVVRAPGRAGAWTMLVAGVGLSGAFAYLAIRSTGADLTVALKTGWALLQSAGDLGDPSVRERASAFVVAARAVREFPLLGVGVGNYGFWFQEFAPTWARTGADIVGGWITCQNLFARVIAETGVLGLLAFLGIVVTCWRTSRLIFKDRWSLQTARALRWALLGLLIAHLGLGNIAWAYVWFPLGLLSALTAERAQDSVRPT